MPPRRIHLIAPAGSLSPYLNSLGFTHAGELLELVRQAVGSDYLVTANEAILSASEDERQGGRTDDVLRARDIQSALEDDSVVALVALRGGAWFTRILPRIDFNVLDERRRPVAVIGFSELTTLVNIVGAHRNGLGIYELSPAFLAYGLRRIIRQAAPAEATGLDETADHGLRDRIRAESRRFFENVTKMIEGRRMIEPIACTIVRGELPALSEATFVGGNLTVFSTLVGSRFAQAIDPTGRWILIEDFNDKPERFDRLLAHLTLAGFWERCRGVLLGDFHREQEDLQDVVYAILNHHLPSASNLPVLTTRQIGHVWPLWPLPLVRPLRLSRLEGNRCAIDWNPELTRVT